MRDEHFIKVGVRSCIDRLSARGAAEAQTAQREGAACDHDTHAMAQFFSLRQLKARKLLIAARRGVAIAHGQSPFKAVSYPRLLAKAINYSLLMRHSLSWLRYSVMFLSAVIAQAAADQPDRLRVAIVIDDGPVPAHVAQFLDLFSREKVHVTFSHEGRYVVAHPEICQAVAAAGHEINNHSYTHPHFKQLTDAAIQREVRDTQEAIRKATGHAPKWFWAPYLEKDDRLVAAVRAAGLEYYPLERFHFIDSRDWDPATDAIAVRQHATTNIKDATVILMHEWPETTFAEMPAIVADLKRQGAEFVTFSQLVEGK